MIRLLIVGHSHIEVFRRAWNKSHVINEVEVSFISLRDTRYRQVYKK